MQHGKSIIQEAEWVVIRCAESYVILHWQMTNVFLSITFLMFIFFSIVFTSTVERWRQRETDLAAGWGREVVAGRPYHCGGDGAAAAQFSSGPPGGAPSPAAAARNSADRIYSQTISRPDWSAMRHDYQIYAAFDNIIKITKTTFTVFTDCGNWCFVKIMSLMMMMKSWFTVSLHRVPKKRPPFIFDI